MSARDLAGLAPAARAAYTHAFAASLGTVFLDRRGDGGRRIRADAAAPGATAASNGRGNGGRDW